MAKDIDIDKEEARLERERQAAMVRECKRTERDFGQTYEEWLVTWRNLRGH